MTAFGTLTSFGYAATPLGRVLVISTETELVGLYFDAHERTPEVPEGSAGETAPLVAVSRQLDEYFRGQRTAFELEGALDPAVSSG